MTSVNLACAVVANRDMDKDGEKFKVFVLKVSTSISEWALEKRYSDLYALFSKLDDADTAGLAILLQLEPFLIPPFSRITSFSSKESQSVWHGVLADNGEAAETGCLLSCPRQKAQHHIRSPGAP